ncbi:MAG: hypothetical protein GX887_07440, partial [Firmicutes bacterium]|nr:hypothetical protein [Bacillota bacterium]
MSRFQNLMVISLVALLVLCFSGVSEVVFAVDGDDATEAYFGNVNADDDINVSDAIAVLRHIVSLASFDEKDLKDKEAWQRADVNLDGDVNVGDAIMILRYIVGLIQEFGPAGPTATVHTETAFLHALDFDHVNTVKLGRDITPAENLEIERNLTLDGDGHAIQGEVVVGSEVKSFTAENIEIYTLTLNGGGTDSVNLMGAIINILNVNVGVSIGIDKDSTIAQIWVAKGAAPSFGGEGLSGDIDIYYVVTFVVKDSSGDPVPEAIVEVFSDSDRENSLAELTTDNNGEAERHFAEGTYEYTVTHDEFEDYSGNFEVVEEEITVEIEVETAAVIDGEKSSVELISNETVEAGEDNIELLLILKDKHGNPISGTFHVVIGGSMPFWEEDVEFSADGEATVTSECLSTATAYFPVAVGGVVIGGFDVTVVAAAPASFDLDIAFDDADDLTFAFTGF